MLALDVQSDDSVAACLGQVLRAAGRLDVLVNKAGVGHQHIGTPIAIERSSRQPGNIRLGGDIGRDSQRTTIARAKLLRQLL